jgi:zinc protease
MVPRFARLVASPPLDAGHGSVALSGLVLERSLADFTDLLEETLTAPGLAEDELERLRRETVAELTEILDNDQLLAQRWFLRCAFGDHPYGRSLVGTPTSLQSIQIADVRACLARQFSRENLVFGFAGAIDAERAERASRAIWEKLPSSAGARVPVPEPVNQKGRRLWFVDKPERTQTQILIGCMGSHPRDPDHFALLVANTVFGGTFTARLTQEVRAKRGWSYGAYSSLGYDCQRQAFSMWTFPKAEDAGPCIALELEMLTAWWQQGISAEELDWAKRYLIQSQAFARDTAAKRVGLRLDEILNDLPAGMHDEFVANIERVTLEDANAAVQKRISLENLALVVVGTHSSIGAQVRDAIVDLASERVVAFDAE